MLIIFVEYYGDKKFELNLKENKLPTNISLLVWLKTAVMSLLSMFFYFGSILVHVYRI